MIPTIVLVERLKKLFPNKHSDKEFVAKIQKVYWGH